MEPSTIVNKTSVVKSVISPRLQKPVVETRRGNSVERHIPVASTKTKTSTTASTTSLNTNCQRLSNISMHIFQPQSKSNVASPVTNKKPTTVNTKTKLLTTHNVPKVKVVPTNSTKESISTANDVNFSLSSSSPSALLTVPNETYQVPKNVTKEIESSPEFNVEPVSSQMIHSSPNLARRDKCHSSASSSAHRHSYSVPQPLTLQGEKTVESDCLLTNSKPVASVVAVRQRRESIKIQPVITELFTDTTTDVQKPAMKSELSPSTNPSTMKMKKTRPNIIKSAKLRKPAASAAPNKSAASNKSKITIKVTGKAEMKCQSTNTDTNEENQLDESSINADGTNALETVKPQVVQDDELSLLQLFEVPTVDDEDIPTCFSPTDQLTLSQTTLMTSFGDIPRRNSIESVQALEISPVLTQNIEPSSEPISQQPKSNEHLLPHSIIRTIYETVQDSIRKDSSIRSKQSQSTEQEPVQDSIRKDSSIRSKKSQSTEQEPVQDSIRKDSSIRSKQSQSTEQEPLQDSIRKDSSIRSKQSQSTEQETTSMTNISTQNKTLPFDATISITQTYNNSDTGLSIRPALRVVIDSLNSRGSETIDSAGSHDDYNSTPLCLETDCDEIYRTGRKGKQVGKGAYGTVWSYLTITGRIIAVKEIELDEDDSERVRNDYQSVREEIHILQALNHPYIVKFLGISLENTRLAKIFMEYLPNGTIENLITSFGPFHNDVLKKYTNQIVEGIAYLHENNVVHRDIKGKNIMLDVDGNIKLIDFGCAKRLKQNQNTHSMRQILKSMKGTANWMAPEVIAETGHGKKADIWSIGCTLCEMATGKPPWSSEHNHLTVLVIIVNGTKPPADLPDTCPVTAQEFFRLCLTRDPISRPSAKDLLSHPFLAS
ncbi:hypothetical protein I4U23_008253 [Adineta vaga]|nr:hypothetical protein I4U23_008253 [Adineta vaga]